MAKPLFFALAFVLAASAARANDGSFSIGEPGCTIVNPNPLPN